MSHTPLRIIFAGTPDFAAASLQTLLNHATQKGYEIVAVYTQPDRPAGRGQKHVASAVKMLAQQYHLPIVQPVNFKQEEDRQILANWQADIMIVAAYGLILPKSVLDTPRLGCINVHASLLPRWRGAAPIHRALMAGDPETGITIMQMDVGLDTGDMLLKAHCAIEATMTAADLHDRLAILGGSTLIEALERLRNGTVQPQPQEDHLACYAAKLTKQEGEIDWSLSAIDIERKIRGLSPWPIAFSQTPNGIMRIYCAHIEPMSPPQSKEGIAPGTILALDKQALKVATGDAILCISSLQFAGGKRLTIQEAINGKLMTTLTVGQRLGAIV